MAIIDGYTIFVDILGMTQYPGAPFTGNIIRDIILFLLVPTIFIIFFVFILLGRLAVKQKGLRFLLGIAIYLFIIAGGYYSTFALLAGPYFWFLLFILGLFYFIPSHFRFRERGGGYASAGGYSSEHPQYENMSHFDLLKQKARVEQDLVDVKKDITEARRRGETRLETYTAEKRRLESELRVIEHQLKFVK